ncbi:ISL3 family transposase (plasmid) [Methylomarinum sp. Ch1-1]|uniref:ISL3 family transposase n=1 Tax=Methylomarinum roseum TaxID=3067653 RepID=A0AAU7NZV8_9GAMM|nr:ISL3 family transposase [Methylomarinum sp. Ch1-1]MDP4523227.1 ISL3 family transposase [Methylomarinum sp. Ch1-1]
MHDLLNLSNFSVLMASDHERFLEIGVENKLKPQACPYCLFQKLYSHDKTEQMFFDTPMQGKPLVLKIQRLRYKCRSCGKTFREPLPDIDDKRLMTARLKDYIQKRAMRDTFAVVARETGLDEKTIRHVFDDYARHMAETMPFQTPRVLGIDELKLVGNYRCILTNIEKNSVFDLLPSRKKSDVSLYFKNIKAPDTIEIVVMDMWEPYRDSVYSELPGRLVVIDKLHVVRMANEAIEKARKAIRLTLDKKDRLKLKNERFVLLKRQRDLSNEEAEKLEYWSNLFPEIGAIYKTKEAFFDIFDQDCDSKTAKGALLAWEPNIPVESKAHFEPLITTLYNWFPEILNGFDYQVTNAYTESINRLARDIQRMGRGYSLDVVRAKMLYDKEANQPAKTAIRKKKRGKDKADDVFTRTNRVMESTQQAVRHKTIIEEKTIYFGPHIPTLCDLFEQGHFD